MRVSRGLALLFFIIGPSSSVTSQAAQHQQPSFTITISAATTVVNLGSDVRVKIAMTNTSDRDIYYQVGLGSIIQLTVHDSEGKLVPETPHGRKIHGGNLRQPFVGTVASFPLNPGKTLSGESILNKEYDLSKPGVYVVQAEKWDYTSDTIVKSDKISLTITP